MTTTTRTAANPDLALALLRQEVGLLQLQLDTWQQQLEEARRNGDERTGQHIATYAAALRESLRRLWIDA